MFQAVADSLITVCLWGTLASHMPVRHARAAGHLVLAVAAGAIAVQLAAM